MKFNRFTAFTLGVLVTAVSVSAVTYASASSDAAIKACANKKTGAMRYISKGACKKTERALTWNQVGQQGLPGVSGAKGDTGLAGADASNGQTLRVVDATGKDMGLLVGAEQVPVRYLVLNENRLWYLASDTYQVFGSAYTPGLVFTDAGCSIPIGQSRFGTLNPQVTFGLKDSSGGTVFTSTGFYSTVGDESRSLYLKTETCSLMASNLRGEFEWAPTDSLFTLAPITAPSYTAPLKVVAK